MQGSDHAVVFGNHVRPYACPRADTELGTLLMFSHRHCAQIGFKISADFTTTPPPLHIIMIHGPPAVLAGQDSRGDAAHTRLCKVMDKKHGRKPAEKGVKAKRVFRLKASLKPSSQIEATAALSSSTKSDDRIPSPDASAQEGSTAAPAVDAAPDDNDDGDGGDSSCAIDTADDQEVHTVGYSEILGVFVCVCRSGPSRWSFPLVVDNLRHGAITLTV